MFWWHFGVRDYICDFSEMHEPAVAPLPSPVPVASH